MTDHLETWQHIDDLKAENASLRQRLEEAERKLEIERKTMAVLVCCDCGRLWADDSDSDQESCETPGCGRFKQRMEWATAQQIEDRDTAMMERATALEAALGELRTENERLRKAVEWLLSDMCFKAPEQAPYMLHTWTEHLKNALNPNGGTDGK